MVSDGFAVRLNGYFKKRVYSSVFIFLLIFAYCRAFGEKRVPFAKKSLLLSNIAAFFFALGLMGLLVGAGVVAVFVSKIFVLKGFFSVKFRQVSSGLAKRALALKE